MFVRSAVLAVLIGTGLAAFAQPARAGTLPEAVVQAINRSHRIKAYEYEGDAAKADVAAVRGTIKPRVGVSAQPGLRSNMDSSGDNYGLSLSLTQSLLDGGEYASSLQRSKASLGATRQRQRETVEATALETVKAYIEVQRTRTLLELTRSNLAVMADIKQRLQQRSKAGFASTAELYQAQSQVEDARLQVESAKSQLSDAIVAYEILTGSPPGKLATPKLSRKALPANLDVALARALDTSPTLLAVKYDLAAAEAAIGIAESALAPKLGLRLSLDYDSGVDGIADQSRSATAQITFRYDLYDGGTRTERVRQSRDRAKSSREDALDTALQVEGEVRTTWNALQVSVDRLDILMRKAKAARRSLELNLQRFDRGKAGLDVILGLQNTAASAEIDYLNEVSIGRFNAYRILAITGGLLAVLGISQEPVSQ